MTVRCHVSLSFLLTIALLLTHAPSPSAAPPVNRIAYIDRAGGLYTIRPDGTGRQEMASGEMLQQASFAPRSVQRNQDFYSWPVWSPNGQRLASFRVELSGGQLTDGLYIFDGVSAQILHSYKEPGLQPIYAYWSPTSQQLGVLLGGRGPFSLNLWPTSGGQRPHRVAQGAPFYFHWRADGQAVLTHTGGSRGGAAGHSISVVAIPTGERHLLSRSPSIFGPPSWSFDGKWLAYGNTVEGQEHAALMIAAGDGSQPESVALVPRRMALEWSPTQPLLAIATTSFIRAPLFEEVRLFDVASGALHPLIQEPVAAFFWSPDGTRILYARRNPERAHWTWMVVDVHSRTIHSRGRFHSIPSPDTRFPVFRPVCAFRIASGLRTASFLPLADRIRPNPRSRLSGPVRLCCPSHGRCHTPAALRRPYRLLVSPIKDAPPPGAKLTKK